MGETDQVQPAHEKGELGWGPSNAGLEGQQDFGRTRLRQSCRWQAWSLTPTTVTLNAALLSATKPLFSQNPVVTGHGCRLLDGFV